MRTYLAKHAYADPIPEKDVRALVSFIDDQAFNSSKKDYTKKRDLEEANKIKIDYSQVLRLLPLYLYASAAGAQSATPRTEYQRGAEKRLRYLAQDVVWGYKAKDSAEVMLQSQVLAIAIRQGKHKTLMNTK